MTDAVPDVVFWIGMALLTVIALWCAWNLFTAVRRAKAIYPRGPLPPETIRPKAGACGVHGCANPRPHSHVADLLARLRKP